MNQSSFPQKTTARRVARLLVSAGLLICCLSLVPLAGAAAILTNLTTSGQLQTGEINVSNLGGVNWAVWDDNSDARRVSIAPFATKVGGVGTISGISALNPSGTVGVRGTVSYASYINTFTWTGGTVAAAPQPQLSGVFSTALATSGAGVTFDLSNLAPLAVGQFYQVSVLTSTFNNTGTLVATVGSVTQSQTGVTHTNKQTDLHQFLYNPELSTDVLTFRFSTNSGTGGSSHALVQGVAVSIVPEPSVSLLALMGVTALVTRRRRSRPFFTGA